MYRVGLSRKRVLVGGAALIMTLGLAGTVSAATRSNHAIEVSLTADRSRPTALAGSTLSGNTFVFLDKSDAPAEVTFTIDGQTIRKEMLVPYDLGGTASASQAAPFDTKTLTDGRHRLTVRMKTQGPKAQSTRIRVFAANFTVNNAGPSTTATAKPTTTTAAPSAPTTTSQPTTTTTAAPIPPVTTTTTAPAVTTTTVKTTTTSTTPVANNGGLLFVDDFSGASGALADQNKWVDYSACTHGPPAAFGLIRCGNDETLNGNGQLQVPATAQYGTALMTKGKFGFTYGTASAWIKLPATAGYWPAFWTLNDPMDGSRAYPVGEVDVMESYTTWNTIHHAGMHSWGQSGQLWGSDDHFCTDNVDLSAAFHKYSARVEPNKVTFYFDDKQCGSVVTPANDWPMYPAVNRPSWLILDLAVGGAGGQQPTPAKADVMLVDRVEVKAL